jgi:hypothetical protein
MTDVLGRWMLPCANSSEKKALLMLWMTEKILYKDKFVYVMTFQTVNGFKNADFTYVHLGYIGTYLDELTRRKTLWSKFFERLKLHFSDPTKRSTPPLSKEYEI